MIELFAHDVNQKINVTKQGYSLDKAAIGVMFFGVTGLAGGFLGSEDIDIECLNCRYRWKYEQAAKRTEAET